MRSDVMISDIAVVIMGQSPKKTDVNEVGDGYPLLNGPTEFTDRHPQPVQFTTNGKRFSDSGDILFCVRGSTTGRMNYADQPYAIGRGIAAIRGKDGYPTPFVRAVIKNNLDRLLIAATGSTFPNVSKSLLNEFVVTVITPGEAEKVNEVIISIEDKIHLNQKTNKTLEAMAQAIFKSWFVDYEPVRAKMRAKTEGRDPNRAAMAAIAGVDLEQDWDEIEATLDQKLSRMREAQRQQLHETAKLFPDELVDSELGEVPKGWGVTSAEKVLKRFKVPKRIKKDEVEETGKIVVLEQGEGIIMGYHNGEAGFDASPDNPYFIFGDHTCITHLTIEPFDVAPNVIPLQGEEFNSYWTYYAVKDLQQFQEYRRHWSELKVKVLITPNNDIDQVFADAIKPLIMQINKNRNQNLTLSQLRDTLLPKLISGEVGL